MRKGIWTIIALIIIMPGLLLTMSCGKKQVEPEDVMVTGPGDTEAADRQREIEEQDLADAARQEAARQEAEAVREEQMAREAFTGDDVFFEYDSAVLTTDAMALLKVKALWMQANPSTRALIEGHCDERGSNEYNLALGDRRAESVKTFLVNLGISASRMTTVSYGEEKPLDTGKSEAAYARNRRAHFEPK